MSTRGLFGLRKNGVDKAFYNHHDSYPDGLGRLFLSFCRKAGLKSLGTIFDNIEFKDYDSENISPEDLLCCTGSRHIFKTTNYIDFIKDSLFCEHAYIANLDDNVLEYWVGFQEKPDPGNRYGSEPEQKTSYYPCRLALRISLPDICSGMVEDEVAAEAMYEAEKEKSTDYMEEQLIMKSEEKRTEYLEGLGCTEREILEALQFLNRSTGKNVRIIKGIYNTKNKAAVKAGMAAGVLTKENEKWFDIGKFANDLENGEYANNETIIQLSPPNGRWLHIGEEK